MKINQVIAILLTVLGIIAGWQSASAGISLWIVILIAFAIGMIVYLLLDEDIFKKKVKKWKQRTP